MARSGTQLSLVTHSQACAGFEEASKMPGVDGRAAEVFVVVDCLAVPQH